MRSPTPIKSGSAVFTVLLRLMAASVPLKFVRLRCRCRCEVHGANAMCSRGHAHPACSNLAEHRIVGRAAPFAATWAVVAAIVLSDSESGGICVIACAEVSSPSALSQRGASALQSCACSSR